MFLLSGQNIDFAVQEPGYTMSKSAVSLYQKIHQALLFGVESGLQGLWYKRFHVFRYVACWKTNIISVVFYPVHVCFTHAKKLANATTAYAWIAGFYSLLPNFLTVGTCFRLQCIRPIAVLANASLCTRTIAAIFYLSVNSFTYMASFVLIYCRFSHRIIISYSMLFCAFLCSCFFVHSCVQKTTPI